MFGVNFNNRLVKICFCRNEYKQKNKYIVGGGGFVVSPPPKGLGPEKDYAGEGQQHI
jgi:hypothetical protein